MPPKFTQPIESFTPSETFREKQKRFHELNQSGKGEKVFIENKDFDEDITLGARFIINGKEFSFIGVDVDGNPVGQFEEEKGLHKVFDISGVQAGVLEFMISDYEKGLKEKEEDEANKKNPPKKKKGILSGIFG